MTFRGDISLAEVPLSLPALSFPSSTAWLQPREEGPWGRAYLSSNSASATHPCLSEPVESQLLSSSRKCLGLWGEKSSPTLQHLPRACKGAEATCRMLSSRRSGLPVLRVVLPSSQSPALCPPSPFSSVAEY